MNNVDFVKVETPALLKEYINWCFWYDVCLYIIFVSLSFMFLYLAQKCSRVNTNGDIAKERGKRFKVSLLLVGMVFCFIVSFCYALCI